MPHRRRVQKGSFGSHFDELVKHFESRRETTVEGESPDQPARKADKRRVRDKLFDKAWNKPR